MQDQPYPSPRPAITREAGRIQTVLLAAGVLIIGTSVSVTDEMADIAWQAPEDGTAWMCVISPLDPALWTEWAQDAQRREDGANDAPGPEGGAQ